MTRQQIADREGVSVSTVARWKRLGLDIEDPAALAAHREGIARQPAAAESDDMRAVRLRKMRAEADRAELHLALVRGQLLPRKDVDLLQAGIGHVINRLTRAILSELLPGFPGGTQVVVRALPAAADSSFSALSDDVQRATRACLSRLT